MNLGTHQVKTFAIQERGCFTDNTGKHWICTTVGVFIITAERNNFTKYFSAGQLKVIYSNQARGIYADTSGHIFANIWNSLCCADNNHVVGRAYSLGGLCYALLPYTDSLFYSFGYHIWEFGRPANGFIQYGPQQEIWAAAKLSSGKLLLADLNGLEVFDPTTKKITPVECNNNSFPPTGHIYRFFNGLGNRSCAVGENGLYVLNAHGCIIDFYGDRLIIF